MARICSICLHDKRLDIDKALVTDKSIPKISKEFGVSEWALRNHKENHLSRQLLKATELRQDKQALDLMTEMEKLIDRNNRILDEAESLGKPYLELSAMRELRSSYEFVAKMLYTIQQQGQPYKVNEHTLPDLSDFTNLELHVLDKLCVLELNDITGVTDYRGGTHPEISPARYRHIQNDPMLERQYAAGKMPHDDDEPDEKPTLKRTKTKPIPDVPDSENNSVGDAPVSQNNENQSEQDNKDKLEQQRIDEYMAKHYDKDGNKIIPSYETDDAETRKRVRQELLNVPQQNLRR